MTPKKSNSTREEEQWRLWQAMTLRAVLSTPSFLALSFPIYPLDATGLCYVDSLTLTFLRWAPSFVDSPTLTVLRWLSYADSFTATLLNLATLTLFFLHLQGSFLNVTFMW